ncbi:conserved hypothetical protein [Pediculus humanus corporis]|uniref:NADH dehydrogenase [ubiquinone] 1 alpha subcomplex assembly factor 4 n=1 Tax=Pediculus humanus subsp. corporis TaxID=121224 RepID=E0VN78_PEDHC|nr:uncharacterized protein Phum_PHUM331410 [Pediculus humanus corporis]EEB14834.1 conserved hypothetical protein [Pediculus humanus corporis]
MGAAVSYPYTQLRRVLRRYNAQNRALKFIEKEKLPSRSYEPEISDPKIRESIKELYVKNKQLDDYLKKEKQSSSKRPLPVKRIRDNSFLFYEPKIPQPNCCTLSSSLEIIAKHLKEPNKWNVDALSEEYNLQKDSVKNLLMYYSLFTREDFQFINKDRKENEEQVALEFVKRTRLEKIPLKQIEDKK